MLNLFKASPIPKAITRQLFFLSVIIVSISASATKLSAQENIVYSDRDISVPEPFAERIISTSDKSEFEIAFSPNGLKCYFSRRAPNDKQKIFESNFDNGKWSEPVLCPFSTDRDESPSITANGKLFFFGSERPIPGKPNQGNFDMNIWMMKKIANKWSTPTPLPFPINDVQVKGEEWPSSNNNLFYPIDHQTFLYTTMVRGTKTIKLYEIKYKNNQFETPVEISNLFNDPKYSVYSAVVSPNGKYLVFNSYGAPGGRGGEDLYISKRINDSWSKAVPMPDLINTTDEESGPRFSRDGRYFFYSKSKNLGNNQFGEWDIYYVETKYLRFETLFIN